MMKIKFHIIHGGCHDSISKTQKCLANWAHPPLTLRWLYYVSSKYITKIENALDFFETRQVCGIYSLDFK